MERTKSATAHVKAVTDTTVTVAGYGVIFGGADLEGETFAPETDYMLDLAPVKLVFYDHTLGDVKHAIGKTTIVEADDFGLWVEAELDRNKSYVAAVVSLVERGALGWSSGSVGHLTRRNGKSITQWPIVELSLTPTPAEPRTLGVEILKSLAAVDASYRALLPEDARPASEPSANTVSRPADDSTNDDSTNKEIPTMEEETTTGAEATVPASDIAAMVKAAVDAAIEKTAVKGAEIQVPLANTKTKLGDDESKAYFHYIRTGDDGGIKHTKASNNNPMGEATPAQGGYAVPTGMYNQIVAKVREGALYSKIGVRQIPGKGLTVNVPTEAARDGAFVSTGEAQTTDRDSPLLGQAPMTLVKYTKRVELSWELMEDEDASLMSFLSAWVGDGIAKTHNALLVTEALANGTLGAAWTGGAGSAAITADDIPELVYALPTGYEDGAAWIVKKTTEGIIRGKTGANFQFVPTAPDGASRRELFGFPLWNSDAVPASAASAKVAIFGNFAYMGMRMAPDITFLRDPYSAANTGQLRLHYYFRTVYKVLQAEAILYATQGT